MSKKRNVGMKRSVCSVLEEKADTYCVFVLHAAERPDSLTGRYNWYTFEQVSKKAENPIHALIGGFFGLASGEKPSEFIVYVNDEAEPKGYNQLGGQLLHKLGLKDYLITHGNIVICNRKENHSLTSDEQQKLKGMADAIIKEYDESEFA